jgi:predicted amidohydrolase
LIVAPWGEVLADAGEEPEAIVMADIDVSKVAEAREQVPALTHDRDITLASRASRDAAE